MGLLPKVPKIEMPRRAKGSKVMKGRPITLEEFERLLDKTPAGLFGKPKDGDKPLTEKQEAARARIIASWRYYLRGLWLSGLRLAESLELWWDRDDKLCVDLVGKRPMLRIPKGLEKGHKDSLLPMAPEFAEFLEETPEADRTGPVFRPLATRVHGERLTAHRVGEIIVKIGEAAGVKVHTDERTGKVKYASAHDLRRSFGERWAHRLMPVDLMALMRHESMETTLRYYVGRNAQATADILWEAHRRNLGDTLGDTHPKPSVARGKHRDVNQSPR
jgi:integrase